MSLLMYKIVFSQKVKNFNSIASICSKISSEEMYRSFTKQNKNLDFSKISIFLSDAMPYIDELYYIPKPAAIISGLKNLDITNQKALRTISYIEITEVENYFLGTYDYLGATKNRFGFFGKTDEGIYFNFAQNAGLYVIIDCDFSEVINLFGAFLRQFIFERIASGVNIFEQSADRSFFNSKITENKEYRISLSSLSTDVSEFTLGEVCENASYIITEKQLTGDICRICYLRPGAVISNKGIQIYSENHQPGCITIGC